MIRLVHGAATHLGLVRRQNEDSFVVTDGIYAVCDGMGGARAGEVASEAACRILMALPRGAGAEELREAVFEANALIRERSLADKDLAGMGTTLTAASARGSVLTLAQVGDSRAYLWHRGTLRQVTEDHSLVAEMIKRGQLTPEQAAVHPHRSIITRAVGTEASVTPDIFDLPLEIGDRVLLCSDGLSGMVPEGELARVLGAGDQPRLVADALVATALRHGGEDNVTAVVIFAVEGEDGPIGDSGTVERSSEAMTSLPALPDGSALAPLEAAASPVADLGDEGLSAGETKFADITPHNGPDGFGPVLRVASGVPARRKPSRRTVLIGLASLLLLLALALGAFLAFNSTVYFVGTADGQVALFRGMPYVVVGLDLYSVVEVAPAPFDSLDTYLQARVDAHELLSKEEGLRFIQGLEASQ